MKPRVKLIDCRTVEEANLIIHGFETRDIIAFIRVDGTGRRRRGDAGQKIQVQVCAAAEDESADSNEPAEAPSKSASSPLPWAVRCAGLLLPVFNISGVIMFGMLRVLYRRRGNERWARELAQWFAAGLLLWGAAALLLILTAN